MLEPPDAATLGCTQCSHQAVWPFQLDRHVQRYHDTTRQFHEFHAATKPELYRCVCCHHRNSSKLGLYEHCISEHNASSLLPHRPRKEFDRFLCDRCDYSGNSSLHLLKHRISCDVGRQPGRARDNKFELALVVVCDEYRCKTEPPEGGQAEPAPEWYRCGKCSFRSERKSALTAHKRTHAACNTNKEWFECDKCPYRTVRRGHLRQHVRHHAAKNRFDCVKCHLRFAREEPLRKHVESRHPRDGIVPLRCDKCPFGSLSKDIMKEHRLVHVDWFRCTNCSYRASKESYLQRHMLLHTKADDAKWASCGGHVKEQGCLKTQMRQRMLELLKSPK